MTPTTAKEEKDLAQVWAEFKAESPSLRIRDAAKALNVGEAELLATRIGNGVTKLRPEFVEILQEFHRLGRIMALTRNEEIVHERKGIYKNVESIKGHGPMGLVVNDDIDLRIFFSPWKFAFASTEEGARGTMRSFQFFDGAGDAIHKVFLTDASDVAEYEKLVEQFRSDDQTAVIEVAERAAKPVEKPDSEIDVEGFRAAWAELKDTHDFYPMTRKFRVEREQALRLADPQWVSPVAADSFKFILENASERKLPIMVFVGNHGMIQIHTGPVEKVLEARGWFNVMDEPFNLHINQEKIARAYVVKKPTADGIVTSLEIFNEEGENVALFFGKRKPGIPESEDWRVLVANLLCKN